MNSITLQPFDRIFNDEWMDRMKKARVIHNDLYCALRKNEYRKEVNKWLIYFENKGWLNRLKQRLRMATTWPSFYSKINELRTGYFFEHRLGFQLTEYEATTNERKNVDFKGIKDNTEFFIEVKTPLDLEQKNWKISKWDGDHEILVYNLLDKAIAQLPQNGSNIIVLCDDLKLPLFYDGTIIPSIKDFLNSYDLIGSVCILGSIFLEDIYKKEYVLNPNATSPIEDSIFQEVEKVEI